MDVHLRRLAERHDDIVAVWQLRRAGWSSARIEHAAKRGAWRRLHRGVYALSHGPLTRRQRWVAATLTAPNSVLSHASAGACYGFRRHEGPYETVCRPGTRGPTRMGGVLVLGSRTLEGDTTRHHDIPITTAERTLIERAPHVDDRGVGRMLREALRLEVTTIARVDATLGRHRGRRGTALLAELATRYARIPYRRTRSDAEARALEVLLEAGVDPPRVNLRIRGEEADFVWPRRRLVIEIDGPRYHRFRDEDERKAGIWRSAGYTVRRIGSQAVYDDPARLVALAVTRSAGAR